MDSPYVLLIVGALLAGVIVMGILIGSIPMAALVYIWKNVYPVVKRMAKWSARLENLLSLAVIDGALFFVIIAAFMIGLPTLLLIFIILLIPVALILLVPIWLGILVWVIRFVRRFYARWRIWLVVNYLRFRTRAGGRRRVRIVRRRRK
ncbi:MAG: hypothetical protein JSW71_18320 [Gemmatimonadota bacterium]|nr:MAG: hypothetical protein JSW71_18320 [Gemmatimonadota bacterium]